MAACRSLDGRFDFGDSHTWLGGCRNRFSDQFLDFLYAGALRRRFHCPAHCLIEQASRCALDGRFHLGGRYAGLCRSGYRILNELLHFLGARALRRRFHCPAHCLIEQAGNVGCRSGGRLGCRLRFIPAARKNESEHRHYENNRE